MTESVEGFGTPWSPALVPDIAREWARSVMAAARTDMEFQSAAGVLRHHVENLLAAFSFAVSNRDGRQLSELLYGVRIGLGVPPCSCPEADVDPEPEQIISCVLGANPASRQTISNITVDASKREVLSTATFQNWTLGTNPGCTDIGSYLGRLTTGREVWRWL